MTYNIDETYFEEIDTEEKAYWLGFIWGDGYTQYRENKNSYVFNLTGKKSPTSIGGAMNCPIVF